MNPAFRVAILAITWTLALRASAQAPANQGVKSTATVEVIEDTAHVDDVITRLKRPPEANGQDLPQVDKAQPPAVQSLKGERPNLKTEMADQEKHGKDDKHGGWRWQRALEQRTEHVRKAKNP
jgi:hypothetical protein